MPSAAELAMERIVSFARAGATIIDLGAVSTRPGAADVSTEEEWSRLAPVLEALSVMPDLIGHRDGFKISIDTTRSEIVRRAYEVIGPFIVNDISAGEDDPEMLPTVAELDLPYIAMHKRGNPQTMNGLCDYPEGVVEELIRYFSDFSERASKLGIHDWILDPGLGFAKTNEQNWEILERLEELRVFGRPILIGAADKRFTKEVPQRILDSSLPKSCQSGTDIAHAVALSHGADILRVHTIPGLL